MLRGSIAGRAVVAAWDAVLALTGREAESCVAPMLRLRARETSISGATGVSMTVFARCRFR